MTEENKPDNELPAAVCGIQVHLLETGAVLIQIVGGLARKATDGDIRYMLSEAAALARAHQEMLIVEKAVKDAITAVQNEAIDAELRKRVGGKIIH